jgi:hypothetical protein
MKCPIFKYNFVADLSTKCGEFIHKIPIIPHPDGETQNNTEKSQSEARG